ncbi:MAG: glycosyltransferase family 9 protein [Bacteroidetes bacterium]|nr:glycosyltransferase family 9 protein [Bacteroidota bacterium]
MHKVLFKSIKNPKKILIFRTGSIGDSICAIPSIIAVGRTFPEASVDILTNAGKENLVGLFYLLNPKHYRKIIDYYGVSKRELFKLLRKEKYDLVIQLPQVDASFTSLCRDMLVYRCICSSGIGWFVSQLRLFTKTQSKYLIFPNENSRLLGYLRENRFLTDGVEAELNIQQEDKDVVNSLFREENINGTDKKLCMVIGAKRPQNRWPIEYFVKVAEYFSLKFKIILIGGSEDSKLAKPLLHIPNLINFCGKLTPMQSAAVLSLCDITLSNDTGPMHMSYTVGTPTIALFSSRDLPGKWYPPEKNNNYIFRTNNVKCQGCLSETCNDNICMKAIMPEKIIAVINNYFNLAQ